MSCKVLNSTGSRNSSRGAYQQLQRSLTFLCLLFLIYTAQSTNAVSKSEPTCNDNESTTCNNNNKDQSVLPDYLIIGAGGSGIQTALLLKKYGHTFRILEKASSAGSFWTRFPRFQELISVNKHVRNETQRYRYDWHSFLESKVGMWEDVSRSYYPSGQEWHAYMNLVVEREGIEVEYGVEVARLDEDGKPCVYLLDGSAVCAKCRVFVGTGLVEKDERYLRAIGGIRYSDVTLKMAEGKRVCILGNGNAGFETAQNLFPVADRVIVVGKRPTRLSAVTKYTGDVRVKFLTTLENFHGKLLDTVVHENLEAHLLNMDVLKDLAPMLDMDQTKEFVKVVSASTYVAQYECELLVLATGFRSSVPGKSLKKRFPSYGDLYAATDNPSISYVGWLMHANDFQRGAGGFLSGYRYLIRNLIHHVREIDHGIPYPYLVFNKQQALEHAVHRIQVADDLIVLQDGVVVRDAIVPMENGEYHYYEGVTYQFFQEFMQREDIIYIYFAWGDGRDAATVFDNVYEYNDTRKLRNIYLHPMVEVNGRVREVVEDLDMMWHTVSFIPPIKRIVRDALCNDVSQFYPKPSYPYEAFEVSSQKDRIPFEEGKQAPQFHTGNLMKVVASAIFAGGTKNALRALRAEAKSVMPGLTFPQKRIEADAGGSMSSDSNNCASAGSSCAGMSCCGNSTSCVYISDFDASFCLDV